MSEREFQELVREERRRYAREWRAKNPEKVKASNVRYWEKRVRERMLKEGTQEVN